MYIINVHIANQSHWASKIEATWNSIEQPSDSAEPSTSCTSAEPRAGQGQWLGW